MKRTFHFTPARNIFIFISLKVANKHRMMKDGEEETTKKNFKTKKN
jgi:hypothetical protein